MGRKPKKQDRDPIAVNLRNARLAAGFESISDAARHIGIPVPTAVAHEGGPSSFRRPKLEQLRKYALAYNTTIDALEGGTIISLRRPEADVPTRPVPAYETLTSTPILATAQAGHWRELDPFVGENGGYTYAKIGKNDAFGVSVSGDSMNRVIQDGDTILVRPWLKLRREPRNNEVLLVQRERDGKFELTIKTYREGKLWPESTNPKWRHPMPFRDGDEITVVGLVIGFYRSLQ